MTRGRVVVALLASVAFSACSDAEPPVTVPGAVVYERIVTLAPNLTELVFTAGAGDSLVGVSAWSDHPLEAAALPVIGDAFMIDRERLALLQPDLLLAWHSGTPAHLVDELRGAGFNVEVMRTSSLGDVAETLRRIGELAGSDSAADRAASEFAAAIGSIGERHRDSTDLRVFYQVSRRPLFTVSGDHYVSELIELCGATNIFADLEALAPTVDVEAVVDRDPEVLLTSSDGGADAFADWDRWPSIAANRYGNRFQVPADSVSRASTRLVVAAEAICAALDTARANKTVEEAA